MQSKTFAFALFAVLTAACTTRVNGNQVPSGDSDAGAELPIGSNSPNAREGTAGAAVPPATMGDAGAAMTNAPSEDAGSAVDAGPIVCVPGSGSCDGNTPRTCQGDGHWLSFPACGGDTPACFQGVCSACSEGAVGCDGNRPTTCADGAWAPQAACPFICSNGLCRGICVPDSAKCSNGAVTVCGADGDWASAGGGCTPQCATAKADGTSVFLIDVAAGTALDTRTGLTWQRTPDKRQFIDVKDPAKACPNLPGGRLPSVDEAVAITPNMPTACFSIFNDEIAFTAPPTHPVLASLTLLGGTLKLYGIGPYDIGQKTLSDMDFVSVYCVR